MPAFIKFPHTMHLLWLGDEPLRDDKMFSEEEMNSFLQGEIIVEEKIDGANLGISFDESGNIKVQNRGNYIYRKSHLQFELLWDWIGKHRSALEKILKNEFILFGEWCYATHSVYYNNLPDWFFAFDIYDRENDCFLSLDDRNLFLRDIGISQVPIISKGIFDINELLSLIGTSRFTDSGMEGIYLRKEAQGKVISRAKIVRKEFVQNIIDHWSKTDFKTNKLRSYVKSLK